MKKVLLLFFLIFTSSLIVMAQWEASASAGLGYMTDNSGQGIYSYTQTGITKKKNLHRLGTFASFVIVDVDFNNYRYQAQEYGLGCSYDTWKKISKNYTFAMWINPQIKFFDDNGKNSVNNEQAFQKDIGSNIVLGFNFNDALNRWFRSYKFQIQYQQAIWSKRQGVWADDDGYLSDKVNFKAVNKNYLKSQFEVTVKKSNASKLMQIEPKLVVACQLDGNRKIMYETGLGLALSYMRKDRYFELGSVQYRIRTGHYIAESLSLIELNVDFVNIYRIIKRE